MTDKQLIIGFGTGRCGTQSLAKFLNQQEGFNVTHESVSLQWEPAFCDVDNALDELNLREEKIVGDVGYYWIHHVIKLLKKYDNIKAVNITRNSEDTVESFFNHNNFIRQIQAVSKKRWYKYPFDGIAPKREFLENTIARYRMLEHETKRKGGNRIFHIKMEELNNGDKLSELLDWLGCKNKNLLPIHENKRIVLNPLKNAFIKRPAMDVLGG